MTADGADDEGGREGSRKRDQDGALDAPDAKRPRVAKKGWGQGLVRKKVPDKKHEDPSSTMVTAVLVAALGSSSAVSRPNKLGAAMRAVKTEDPVTDTTASACADDQAAEAENQSEPASENCSEPAAAEVEKQAQAQEATVPVAKPAAPMSKEELLLTIETTDSEIAKLEARLAELKRQRKYRSHRQRRYKSQRQWRYRRQRQRRYRKYWSRWQQVQSSIRSRKIFRRIMKILHLIRR